VIVERYRDEDASVWNAFERDSRNGTFQFDRGYMDYHRDRFVDHSMLIRSAEGELLALLPAHIVGETISSHNGLSFGGVISGPRMTAPLFLRAFETLLLNLQQQGLHTVNYKTMPHIYHRQPTDEDRYALYLIDAKLVRRDLLSVVFREDRLPYQSRRVRGIKKAQSAGVSVQQESDFSAFWSLLSESLAARHGAEPIHILEEMHSLRERFPANIQLHTSRSKSGELLGGVVVYISNRVAHAQYIASSAGGRDVGALDLLFDTLLNGLPDDVQYFDFGSSHEDAGRIVNQGLIEQKEGFGARSVTFDRYLIDLTAIRPGVLTGALR